MSFVFSESETFAVIKKRRRNCHNIYYTDKNVLIYVLKSVFLVAVLMP